MAVNCEYSAFNNGSFLLLETGYSRYVQFGGLYGCVGNPELHGRGYT